MPRIILALKDRERFGCAEELSWRGTELSIDEAIALQEYTGISWSDWGKALAEMDPRAVKAAVWMALNRAGHQIGWTDVRFDLLAITVLDDDQPSPGKDLSSIPPPTSEPDETP